MNGEVGEELNLPRLILKVDLVGLFKHSKRMSKKANIETAWKAIFKDFRVVEHIKKDGFFDITSPELNPYFQSRLLCKIDFKEKLPTSFKINNLSILALSNGIYRIASTDPYFKIDVNKLDTIPVENMVLPSWIDTIDPENITSESQALDAAAASGILEKFTGVQSTLTVRGRKYCSSFNLKLPSSHASFSHIDYPISGVQIEIDGGYESASNLILIEAKNTVSKTMNIRQLIYPQLHFEAVLTKAVSTIVMFYSKKHRIFNFIPVKFESSKVILNYNEVKRFSLETRPKLKEVSKEIDKILPSGVLSDMDAPFPQANDFDKVIDAFDILLERGSLSKAEIFEDLPVTVVGRQYDYYINALRWMKLVFVNDGLVELSERGKVVSTLNNEGRLRAMQKIFLSDPLVAQMLNKNITECDPELFEVYGISGTTPKRRQSTVRKWDSVLNETIDDLT